MSNKSIILLSGGVDSAVSLASTINKENVSLALFFNYGQKSFAQEKKAVEAFSKYYDVNLEIINLDWLKSITTSSLVNNEKSIPNLKQEDLNNINITKESVKKVWIPNRNALFINIAGSYADSYNYDKIIIGANKEEAETFPDNSKNFIQHATELLAYSTQTKPIVIAPLIDYNKQEIMELGKSLNLPFEYIWSCYSNTQNHCGTCESCNRLKRGLERANLFDIVNLLFKN